MTREEEVKLLTNINDMANLLLKTVVKVKNLEKFVFGEKEGGGEDDGSGGKEGV